MIEPIPLSSVWARDELIKLSARERDRIQFARIDRKIWVIVDGQIILETRERHPKDNGQMTFYLFLDDISNCRAVRLDEALLFLAKYKEIQNWFLFNMSRFV